MTSAAAINGKWAALRVLAEENGAGHALLAAASGLRETTIARRARRQGWGSARGEDGAAAPLQRAINAAVRELEVISTDSGPGTPSLDRGRIETVLAMLKTVEKLGQMTGVDPRPAEAQARSDADIAAALRRIDERIVELALEAAGRMGDTGAGS